MAREIKNCSMTTKSGIVERNGDVLAWLVKNAPDSADTLLAFDLEGLIWGKIKSGTLTVAPGSVPLQAETLQEARLFGKTAELHLWLCDGAWHYRITQDNDAENGRQYIEEQQMLWGDQPEPADDSDFTLMADGVQGLRHTVPLPVPNPTPAQAVKDRHGQPTNQYKERPLRLTVRHYLAEEPFARIEFSRLVKVKTVW